MVGLNETSSWDEALLAFVNVGSFRTIPPPKAHRIELRTCRHFRYLHATYTRASLARRSPERRPIMDTPQFQKAEYASVQGTDICKGCGQPAGNPYYRVNGRMACAACAEKARLIIPVDQHSAFVRGIVFGIGGAIVGLIAYSTFAIVTGVVIGFAALAVGYIVAKAMMLGSRGMGGRRYQIAAALLTYFAVSMSVIPISISEYLKAHPNTSQGQAQTTTAQRGDNSEQASDSPNKHLSLGAVVASM